ncbi:MAG TPA: proton-conducting transporter membrane subunit [Candidatus Nitrosotalea sp.]|nr:proton-conducting transporter membrane subunit [Candidatus Nitrosotalea sp.]
MPPRHPGAAALSQLLLTASAASVASVASSARSAGFNPARALPWAVPAILLLPLFALVLLLIGVRSRRSASNLTLVSVLATLIVAAFVFWIRAGTAQTYQSGYAWIVSPVAVTGASQFQNFTVEMAIQADHFALTLALAVLALAFLALLWHRVGGRSEPGPIRFQASALLLVLSALGVLLASDLVEIYAFWSLAGVASYLLLSHRWGTEAAARASRLALSLPLLGDFCLLLAVAVLYSRYGVLELHALIPVLHTTPGAGLKSLTAAAGLILVAVAVRAAAWPFHAWQTGTVGAAPAALALSVGVWPLLAGSLLYRCLPLIAAAGPQARELGWVLFALGALLGPLLALVSSAAPAYAVLIGSGAVALTLLAVLGSIPAALVAGCLAALALARGSAQLALSSVASAFRSGEVQDLSGARRRLPRTSASLVLALLALSVAPLAALVSVSAPPVRPILLAGLILLGLSALLLGAWVTTGVPRRRRTFDPGRIREVPASMAAATLALALLAAVAAVLGFVPAWRQLLVPRLGAPGMSDLPWIALLAVVLVGSWLLARARGSVVIAGLGRGATQRALAVARAGALWRRFGAQPAGQATAGVEGALGRLESALGGAVGTVSALGAGPAEAPVRRRGGGSR